MFSTKTSGAIHFLESSLVLRSERLAVILSSAEPTTETHHVPFAPVPKAAH